MQTDWKYYNHAIIPRLAPHEQPNVTDMDSKDFWHTEGGGMRSLLDGHQILIATKKVHGGMS